mgnify:CR=1 FL=1
MIIVPGNKTQVQVTDSKLRNSLFKKKASWHCISMRSLVSTKEVSRGRSGLRKKCPQKKWATEEVSAEEVGLSRIN